MTFTIRWSRQAERFLGKLPRQIAHRIVTKVNTIRDDPFCFLEHYEGAAIFKLRIGSYRLLVDVDLGLPEKTRPNEDYASSQLDPSQVI